MLNTIRRWMNRSKLADARMARQIAQADYQDAKRRRDTRDINRAGAALMLATFRVMDLER